MFDAIIFDFDGVVVDSEPVHLDCFRAVLAKQGVELSSRDYYEKYLGFDDHDCFAAVLVNNGRAADEELIAAMTAEKTQLVQRVFSESVRPLAGAVELMRSARDAGLAVGVCSGALRAEIELAAATVGATELVDVLVAAKDVANGKPDPQGYVLTLKLLGEKLAREIDPERTWVVEDSPAGVAAGKAAGCRVLAVTNSYESDELTDADRIVDSLTDVTISELDDRA